jgi:hypothetical protein
MADENACIERLPGGIARTFQVLVMELLRDCRRRAARVSHLRLAMSS